MRQLQTAAPTALAAAAVCVALVLPSGHYGRLSLHQQTHVSLCPPPPAACCRAHSPHPCLAAALLAPTCAAGDPRCACGVEQRRRQRWEASSTGGGGMLPACLPACCRADASCVHIHTSSSSSSLPPQHPPARPPAHPPTPPVLDFGGVPRLLHLSAGSSLTFSWTRLQGEGAWGLPGMMSLGRGSGGAGQDPSFSATPPPPPFLCCCRRCAPVLCCGQPKHVRGGSPPLAINPRRSRPPAALHQRVTAGAWRATRLSGCSDSTPLPTHSRAVS